MRVVFLGSDRWSVPSLRALANAQQIDVALVVTREPKPAGRGSALRPTAGAGAPRARGLPPLAGERVGNHVDAVRAAEPDVLIVVAYGELLRREVLDIAPAINVHFSVLPRWRGAAPVQWAILEGDPATGVTTMLMDEGLDTGPILLQQEEPILAADDAGSLGERLATIGGSLILSTVQDLSRIQPRRQDGAAATLAPKLSAGDAAIVRVTDHGGYSNLAIPGALRRSALSTRDRAFAAELAYGTIRRIIPLDHAIDRFASRPVRRMSRSARATLRLGAYQLLFTAT